MGFAGFLSFINCGRIINMGKITEIKRMLEKKLARDFGKKNPVKMGKQISRQQNQASRMERRKAGNNKRGK